MARTVSKQFLKFREIDFEMQKYTLEFWADAASENPDYREHTQVRAGGERVAHRRGQSSRSSHLARRMSQAIRLAGGRTPVPSGQPPTGPSSEPASGAGESSIPIIKGVRHLDCCEKSPNFQMFGY